MIAGVCDAGGYLCADGHELRVTARCLTEDLGLPAASHFADLLGLPIVRALVGKRGGARTGGKTVGPVAGDRTLHHLGLGDDHRGSTWWDTRFDVVWLCAYRGHRSGAPGDSFPYFRELISAGLMMPTRPDYERLERDRSARAVIDAVRDGQRLLALARTSLGIEVRGTVALRDVGVVVEVVETLDETYVAIRMRELNDPDELSLILLGIHPDREFGDWQAGRPFPPRSLDLDAAEMCWSILHDPLPDG